MSFYYKNVLKHDYNFKFSQCLIYKRPGSNQIYFLGAQEELEDILAHHTVHSYLRDVIGGTNFNQIEYKINPEIYYDFDHFVGPDAFEESSGFAQSPERARDPPGDMPLFVVTILPKYTLREEYETFLTLDVKSSSISKDAGSSVVRFRFYKAAYLVGNENSEMVPYYPMKSEEYAIYIAHQIRKLHAQHFGRGLFYRTFRMDVLRLVFSSPNYFDLEIDYRSSSCLHFAMEQEYPTLDASMFFPLTIMEISGIHPTQSPSIRQLLEMITHKDQGEGQGPAQCAGASESMEEEEEGEDMEEEESKVSGKRKLDQFKEEHKNDPKDPLDPVWRR